MLLGYIGGKEVLVISPTNSHSFVECLRDCLQYKQAGTVDAQKRALPLQARVEVGGQLGESDFAVLVLAVI